MKLLSFTYPSRKRSIRFYKYFLSYVILLVAILFIVGTVVYGNFITTLQNEVEASTVSSLAQIRDITDTRIREMEKISLQISSNPDLTPFKVSEEGYSSYKAIKELGKYRSSNSLIYDIALIYTSRDTGNLYAASGVFNYASFFGHFYQYETWSEKQFFELLDTLTMPVMRPAETVKINGVDSKKLVTYICPLPINQGKPYGAVMFLIEESKMRAILDNVVNKHSGYMYIMDKNNEPLVSAGFSTQGQTTAEQLFAAIGAESLQGQVNQLRSRYGDYSIIRLTSDYNMWTYVAAIPTENFLGKVLAGRRVFNYTVLSLFVIGMLASFLLASKNYRSLRAIVQRIADRKAVKEMADNMDEIAYLSQAFDKVISEKEGLLKQLGNKSELMKERILISLLKGKQDVRHHMPEMLSISGLVFEHPAFVVLLFGIDDFQRFRSENSLSLQNLFKFSIINIAEELSLEAGIGYGVDLIDDRGVVLVLNYCAADGERAMLTELAENIKRFYKQNYKFSLTVGIGGIVHDLSMLARSYEQANKAIAYRFIKGSDQVIYYDDIDFESPYSDYYPWELEEQLIKALKAGKAEEAQALVSRIFDEISGRSLSLESAKYVCSGIVHKMIGMMDELNYKISEYLREHLETILVQDFETLEMARRILSQACRQICEHISQHKESKNFILSDKIIAYIQENYNDNSLSQESIAGRFNLSPSYVSRYVKDQTGETLKQHIDRLRMEEAKKWLAHSELTVRHIVERVGYVDETNFIRKFKKQEGITPIQYRKTFHL
ncbi:helix-turn-helix domain-containing protein [Paenibacillus doosanensis]|uniref:helix-turn-helix domain-containing protein n=1 Tax=Paenibacillus doosanensis TaxID=1229154 RepID=UPI00217FCC80|nr:helix-turn-helix domain-containing protein [Paenibacillus doosanensis]MCS7462866.1 helix-turn-helix domain-containing protein [Paenibacillus doosanensis]